MNHYQVKFLLKPPQINKQQPTKKKKKNVCFPISSNKASQFQFFENRLPWSYSSYFLLKKPYQDYLLIGFVAELFTYLLY